MSNILPTQEQLERRVYEFKTDSVRLGYLKLMEHIISHSGMSGVIINNEFKILPIQDEEYSKAEKALRDYELKTYSDILTPNLGTS